MKATPISILVVEDDKAIAAFLQTVLEIEGFSTTVAGNGRAAFDRANQSPPNSILLDLMRPGIDSLGRCKMTLN